LIVHIPQLTITFENDNKVIIYALEMIISYAQNHEYIFVAQSVWWITLIVGLQEDLVNHIDNLKELDGSTKRNPEKAVTAFPRDMQEESNCEPKK
jgi:hypothetical protein